MADIQGDDGIDFLIGTSNDDSILGGGSSDFIFGRNGDDQIFGEAGNDVMAGGKGADTFYFGANSGHDLVVDFNPSEDDQIGILRGAGLQLDNIFYNPFLDATTIHFAGNNTATFLNTTVADVKGSLIFPF
jgi:Ca2+-binding RTX toxin-like protein